MIRRIFLLEQIYELVQYMLTNSNLSTTTTENHIYISVFSATAKITWRSEQGQTYIQKVDDLRTALADRYHEKFEVVSYDCDRQHFFIQELKYYTCIFKDAQFLVRNGYLTRTKTSWDCMVISKRLEAKLSKDFCPMTYVTAMDKSVYSVYAKALKRMQRKERDVL